MNRTERAKMVEAMHTIMMNLNDEEYTLAWYGCGVADGEKDFADDCYTADGNFSEMMSRFAVLMRDALNDGVHGALYCDGVIS